MNRYTCRHNHAGTSFFFKLFIVFILVFGVQIVRSQKVNDKFEYHISRATSSIKIDGKADEQAWLDAETVSGFYMVLPMDTSLAKVQTKVSMAYDDENIYFLAICYNPTGTKLMVQSLRKDFEFQKNDNFIVFIDPFNDQTTGYAFGTNAFGAQWDGTMFEGGKVDLNWDNKWYSAVGNYDDRWVLEAAIPFKTIRYKKGAAKWGINFSRNDLTSTEKSSWTPIPRQFPTASLSHAGNLIWDGPPPTPGSNVSVIPYVLGGVSKDFESKDPKSVLKKDAGADVKVSVGPSLNLDLTYRPDFSQVEVDQQIINLSRFELFFPERRQFFLENADLFASFGYPEIQPFFSRRIGLEAPINFSARLSGKLTEGMRIGVMDIQTAKVGEKDLPSQNFAVLSLQQRVFKRSYVSVLYVDRSTLKYPSNSSPTAEDHQLNSFNRNIGVEYNLASSNNVWTGKAMVLKSFRPGGTSSDSWTEAANLQYNSRHWKVNGQFQHVGEGYTAEVGYVPRKGYNRLTPSVNYLFFPKGNLFLSHGPQISTDFYFDNSFRNTDRTNIFSYFFTFRTTGTLRLFVQDDKVQLLTPFDPTNLGKDSILAGENFQWNSFGFEYSRAPQHLFTYHALFRYGGYYLNGNLMTAMADVGYRFQPYVNIALSANYNRMSLPHLWGLNNFWLIGPRVDVTFTNNLFFTTYVQYNSQLDNLNINTRFQWRYKPASDLFIVYTDNYYPESFSARNRALVIKLNYWLNL